MKAKKTEHKYSTVYSRAKLGEFYDLKEALETIPKYKLIYCLLENNIISYSVICPPVAPHHLRLVRNMDTYKCK